MYDAPSAQIHNGETLRFRLGPSNNLHALLTFHFLKIFSPLFSNWIEPTFVGALNDCFWPVSAEPDRLQWVG